MADLRISELPALAGALLGATDPVAVADLSASETKKVTVKDLIQFGVQLIDDNSIPGPKVNTTIPPGSIGTTELADDAVTSSKLADQSSAVLGSGLPATGAYIGQLAVNTDNNLAYIWNGSGWGPFAGAAGVVTVQGDATGVSRISATQNGSELILDAYLADTTAPAQFLAGPTSAGGAIEARALVGTDLPVASATARGAVQVNGNGLAMSGETLVIDNAVTPSTAFMVVQFDANGLIVDGRLISSADLPIATTSEVGVIRPSLEFIVNAAGTLSHANTVLPGTATKVTFNGQGHITGSAPLEAADIPSLDAGQLGSGELNPARYGNRSIPQDALADYAVAYIQEAEPGTDGASAHAGMFWFQESTGVLRMWNGNSWFPVGFGRLAQDNLRWGGLFDASTGLVTGVTNFGIQAGLAVGGPIPAATDLLGGLYLVAEVAGSNVSVTPGVVYDAGDWLLCVNQTNGWTRIDTLSGGGGGGANFLNDLFDVTLVNSQTGQVLMFNAATGQWENKPLPPSGVSSVFGRSGAVVATEGDYSLDLMGDVDLQTTAPAAGDLLSFDGTDWVPVAASTVSGVTSVFGRTGAVVAGEGDYQLDQLGDVTITTPALLNVLQFDGNGWINAPATDAATASTLMMRDANGSTTVNVINAAVFNIDALPALP